MPGARARIPRDFFMDNIIVPIVVKVIIDRDIDAIAAAGVFVITAIIMQLQLQQ